MTFIAHVRLQTTNATYYTCTLIFLMAFCELVPHVDWRRRLWVTRRKVSIRHSSSAAETSFSAKSSNGFMGRLLHFQNKR